MTPETGHAGAVFDVRFVGETRLLVVSGSNMSGKSTLLRSVGINIVQEECSNEECQGRATYWSLTPYGEQQMIQLRAIPKINA